MSGKYKLHKSTWIYMIVVSIPVLGFGRFSIISFITLVLAGLFWEARCIAKDTKKRKERIKELEELVDCELPEDCDINLRRLMEELKKELAELKEVQRIEDSEQQQQQQQRVEVLEKELAELKQQQRIDALEQELQALKSEKSPDQRSAVKNSSASASMRRSISSSTVSGKRRAISAPSAPSRRR